MTSRTPIPLAVFMTTFDAGGTERQMTELIRRLDRSRFDVHVACFHRRGVWLRRVEEVATEVVEFPITSFRSPSTWRQAATFASWCRSRGIAVLQAADLYANAFALPASRLAGVPARFGSRREVHLARGRALERVQHFGYRCAHRVVANSEAGAARLRDEGIAADRISVVRNGLNLDAYRARRAAGHRLRLITVARLRPEKAHEVLIAALASMRPALPQLRLQIVGDGPREAALRALVAQEQLDDRVEFLGHRDDIPHLLQQADVFVLPSRSEASPNAVLEAMAAGLPVVASDVGGIPEVITDDVNGVLVPPDDPRALAAALFRLLDDRPTAIRLGQAACRFVEAHYSFERMVSSFETLYLAELNRRGYRAPAPGMQPGRMRATAS